MHTNFDTKVLTLLTIVPHTTAEHVLNDTHPFRNNEAPQRPPQGLPKHIIKGLINVKKVE